MHVPGGNDTGVGAECSSCGAKFGFSCAKVVAPTGVPCVRCMACGLTDDGAEVVHVNVSLSTLRNARSLLKKVAAAWQRHEINLAARKPTVTPFPGGAPQFEEESAKALVESLVKDNTVEALQLLCTCLLNNCRVIKTKKLVLEDPKVIYFNFTLDDCPSAPPEVRATIRRWFATMRSTYAAGALHSYLDRHHLVLYGQKGHGTTLHMDWALAINLALALSGAGADASALVLALWLIIEPKYETLAWAMEALKVQRPDDDVERGKGQPGSVIAETVMRSLVEAADAKYGLGQQRVTLLEQRHGDTVAIQAGYAHAVVNLQPCIKLAFDFVTKETLPHVLTANAMLGCRAFGPLRSRDYVDAPGCLAELLANDPELAGSC